MDGGAWWAAVPGVTKSQTRLSDFTFSFYFHALEKEMATHSSILAWRIPGTGSLVGCRLWGRTESDMTEQLHFHALEKEMATHSSVLSWRISGTGEPGGLPSMGLHRVGHDFTFTFSMPQFLQLRKAYIVIISKLKYSVNSNKV